jgi:glycosyltransferase involved in cell wall biosynthesis
MTVNNKDKRILWLINHTTLREFEVPLLVSLGYEVYTPKGIPDLIYDWSGSVDYTYDKTLTIPAEALEILNQHDFYDTPFTPAVTKIINDYFGTAFCIFYVKLLEQVAYNFEGRILLRAFGLDKTMTYGRILNANLGNHILSRLQLLGDRFWFSQSYPHLHEVEPNVLKQRKVYHPLGLPDSFFKHKDCWVGGVNKILFFCSRIKVTPVYYGKIYDDFKKNFGDLPHLIAGNQPISVDDDPHVAGYQSRDTVEKWLSTYSVMFYHSEEPRHLHYHPLEAIAHGMPLVFMKEGILGKIGNVNQPGACETIKEAREKITRILAGDKVLIDDIRRHQTALLEPFTLDHCRREWQTNFVEKIMSTPLSRNLYARVKTIGIFLPVEYRGGSLNGAKNIAKMLHLGSRAANEPINVIFSCVANNYDMEEDFGDLIELGIPVRETTWKVITKDEVELALKYSGENYSLDFSEYVIPIYSVSNFNECDFWLIISDRVSRPVAPIKPYGMVIYDYIQRYVPEIFGTAFTDTNFLIAARNANFILTTTPNTREDAIQYAGLSPHRTHLAPMEFNTFNYKTNSKKIEDEYFVWPTNASQHKNHLNAVKALEIYYRDFDGKFKVIMTGPTTQFFNDSEYNRTVSTYITSVIDLIQKSDNVKKQLTITGNLAIHDYVSILKSAKFLWHPTIIDNGTYSVIEAAYHDVPSLSSNYPQMHYINNRFNLNLEFCNAKQPRDMAMQLKKMEEEYHIKKQLLPTKERLEQFSYHKVAPEFWRLIRSLL